MATDAPDITPDEDGPGDAVGWSPETARGGEEAYVGFRDWLRLHFGL